MSSLKTSSDDVSFNLNDCVRNNNQSLRKKTVIFSMYSTSTMKNLIKLPSRSITASSQQALHLTSQNSLVSKNDDSNNPDQKESNDLLVNIQSITRQSPSFNDLPFASHLGFLPISSNDEELLNKHYLPTLTNQTNLNNSNPITCVNHTSRFQLIHNVHSDDLKTKKRKRIPLEIDETNQSQEHQTIPHSYPTPSDDENSIKRLK